MKLSLVAVLTLTVTVTGTTVKELINSNKLFAAAVYKNAEENREENFLVSPFSAQTVLALAQSGAKNETAEEIRSALQLTNQNHDSAFQNLLNSLNNEEEFSLHTANKIYIGELFPVRKEFKKTASTFYFSESQNIDFSKSDAANVINQWVENQTEQKIRDLVDPSVLGRSTPAVIINALYFKGRWFDDGFQKGKRFLKDFHKTNNNTVKVEMMSAKRDFYGYYEDASLEARFLELAFEGDAQMVIVLPNDKNGLPTLEKHVEEIFKSHSFEEKVVDVTLPLFRIENSVDFKKILQKLKVRKAFVTGEADFSGIASSNGDLAVAEVLQKTFIHVDQNGVEAAAATSLIFPSMGFSPGVSFVADHPFIFYLKAKDVILFVGKVSSPSQ